MNFFQGSLRFRIFISMILLVLGASVLIAGITVMQYKEEAEELHIDKLERKEKAIRSNIEYVFRNTTYPLDSENLYLIFKEKIFEIQEIHNEEINIYDLDGVLRKSSFASFYQDSTAKQIPEYVLDALEESADRNYVERFTLNGQRYQSSYSYLTDNYFKPIGILNLPYIEDDGFMERELKEFLVRLSQVYLFMLVAAIVLAYFLSNNITQSLKAISDKILKTSFEKANPKISTEDASIEILPLIKAYNQMIDELEESAEELAKSEREAAWRQMARQVAHEIKNPLTPMRLSVQSFERSFDPAAKNWKNKLHDFCETLIQQIDTMSSIASAFSSFAKMPAQQDEVVNVSETVRLALEIFNDKSLRFIHAEKDVYANFDKTQLIRVITNLVKNAQQATQDIENPTIVVEVFADHENVFLKVIDNGIGIEEENFDRIFEPKFTTKSSGMGLGLGMVKNIIEAHKGTINLSSKLNKGTKFTLQFPKV